VELVLEAFDQYWRRAPHVKRAVLKVIPDEATRLIALKRGEVASPMPSVARWPKSSGAPRASC